MSILFSYTVTTQRQLKEALKQFKPNKSSTQTLRNGFEAWSISRLRDIPWPAPSPEFVVCDFNLRGYLKFKVYKLDQEVCVI